MLAFLTVVVAGMADAEARRGRRGPARSEAARTSLMRGKATYYAHRFQGRKTASGARYDRKKLTAAHRTLPFGTKVRVTNVANGESVVVTVNDRGPFSRGRVVDLSYAAAAQIGMIKAGVVTVTLEVVERPAAKASRGRSTAARGRRARR